MVVKMVSVPCLNSLYGPVPCTHGWHPITIVMEPSGGSWPTTNWTAICLKNTKIPFIQLAALLQQHGIFIHCPKVLLKYTWSITQLAPQKSNPSTLSLCLHEALSPTLQKSIGSTGWQFYLVPYAACLTARQNHFNISFFNSPNGSNETTMQKVVLKPWLE